jgi:hypothetical protein
MYTLLNDVGTTVSSNTASERPRLAERKGLGRPFVQSASNVSALELASTPGIAPFRNPNPADFKGPNPSPCKTSHLRNLYGCGAPTAASPKGSPHPPENPRDLQAYFLSSLKTRDWQTYFSSSLRTRN